MDYRAGYRAGSCPGLFLVLLCFVSPAPHSLSAFFPTGGTLVWQDNTAVNYSNWGPPGLGPSMLSHNSCYWIQSSNGLWRPGACANTTMGVVCKLPRGEGVGRTAQPPPPLLSKSLGRARGCSSSCR